MYIYIYTCLCVERDIHDESKIFWDLKIEKSTTFHLYRKRFVFNNSESP